MANISKKMILKGRLSGTQRNRLKCLLDMYYRPSELAEEVGFARRQVYRVYIKLGCPHNRDEHRHIFINGKEFREWYEETYPRFSIANNEAFCLTCKMGVKIVNPVKMKKGRLHYLESYCPHCGRKISRITDKEKLYK
jgi:Zn finger protein HypA/HybF involved in hydrogenase expression